MTTTPDTTCDLPSKSVMPLRSGARGKGLLLAASSAALVAGGAPLLSPSPAAADDVLTVTTLDDSGAGSLREAILAANADADHDTIVFAVTGTITLTSGLPKVDNYSLTIEGGGITIEANGYSALDFDSMKPDTTVSISNLTVNGARTEENGGGIRVDAEQWGGIHSIDIFDVTVSNNTTTGRGGGLYLYGADSIVLDNVTVTGNTAESGNGGGAYIGNSESVTIRNSSFTSNDGSDGGGIFINGWNSLYEQKVVTIENTVISSNTASGCGGGIGIEGGGGNYVTLAVTLSRTTVSGNSSDCGGGIETSQNQGGTLEILSSTIANNTTTGWGGGLYIQDDWTTTIANSTISGNHAVDGSGAVYGAMAGLYLIASTVVENTTDGRIGGLELGGPAFLFSSIVAGNSGYDLAPYDSSPYPLYAIESIIGSIDPALDFTAGAGTQTGVDFAALDLGPLADNGGPTLTRSLGATSIAIDAAGSGSDLPSFVGNGFDQRGNGFVRIVGGLLDVGAFEVQSDPAPTTTSGGDPVVPEFTG